MTLAPIDNRRVHGVAAESYRLNDMCAHPGCKEPAVDPHHIFPRSLVGNTSWFVQIETDNGPVVIPHVTGLCRDHHDDVTEHRAWIRLEDDVFNWYFRNPSNDNDWLLRGKLNPQPPAVEPRPKRSDKRPRKTGDERRQRRTITLRVPNGADEDGAGLLDDAIEQAEEKFGYPESRSPYYTLMDALNWVILNTGPEDFR